MDAPALSMRLCLVGRPNGIEGTAAASHGTVAFINLITETSAGDFVYSSSEEYVISSDSPFMGEDGEAYRRDVGRMV
jgi:hypothetical protein